MAGLASLALVAGLTMAATPASAQVSTPGGPDAAAPVEQQVWDELAADGSTTFWVYLDAQADLSAAAGIADREAQGWFVYEQLTQTADASQADLLSLLDEAGVTYRSFWIANTVKVTGDAGLLERIAALPGVSQVTADRTYELVEPQAGTEEQRINDVEWGIDRVRAPEVWDEFGVRGEDIVVASIDTGAEYDHPALVNQYRGNLGGGEFDHNYNWHDPSLICGNPSLVPCDNNGHGTHVTGTMVGDDGGDNQIGVAPHAQWIAAKGCETTGCSTEALLSSGEFITAPTDLEGENPDPAMRPHIVNNSWGGGATSDPWYQPTVQAWVAAGIFPQFAAGNPGSACGQASNPGNLPESYAAGAFDINDNIASFSGRGPSAFDDELIKPNLSAPGVNVRSSVPGGGYGNFSGTSMASPHVAGVVALMWSAAVAIERDIDTTRELLDMSAEDTEDLTCGGTAENNNVWGQGKLDAFEAVELSPRGPTGLLSGTVTDADTGDPIGGATVSMVGEVERDRTTAADGTYSITLPIGDYDLSASAFGYLSADDQVTIVEDQTHTVDFALDAADSVTVSGQVTDGSGHGWALYAQVTAVGTGVSTFTDPLTGAYSLTLPAQANYTLQFSADYPGYAGHTEEIAVGDDDLTVNASLEVENCAAAPGYGFDGVVGIVGDFENHLANFLDSRGIPSSAFSFGDDPADYDAIIVHRPTLPGQATFQQFLDDTDAAGTGVIFLDNWSAGGIWMLWQYTDLVTTRATAFDPAIPHLFYEVVAEHEILDGFEAGDQIEFEGSSDFRTHAWFDGYAGDVIAHAGRADTGTVGPGIGVQERDNNRHALLSLHGVETWVNPSHWTDEGGDLFVNSLEWVVDGAAFECFIIDGGLVLGNVEDMNTGDGVNGATVASAGEPADRGTSRATPADPNLDDGFYWLFSSLTGSQDFTASASGYQDDSQTVDVTASATNEANFVLGAGILVIDPDAVEATVQMGESADRTFSITNEGTAPVEVELTERRGSFEILGGGHSEVFSERGEVQLIEGNFSPASGHGLANLPESERQPALLPSDVAAEPWEDIANYPTAVMDNSAAVVDDLVYSFGGFTGTVTADSYVYNPAADEWSQIASLPGPRQKPGVVEIDGLVYVVGGWDAAGATMATTLIYDPASDSWSEGADMPAGRTAPGTAVLDGQLYVVGGCTTNACPTSNTVWRYDPGGDSWEELANYPQNTGWLACGGLEDRVFCAGGTDGAGTSTSTFAYDPGSDSWSQVASMPYDNWAMAFAAVDGQLVVSGGVTQGFAQVTNQSALYDPASDSWAEIEPANHAVYRMGSACGFYKVGGSVAGFSPVVNSEVHPEYAECDVDVDVPWLEVSPLTATLQPGESLTVTVSMDSSAEGVDQPGTYTAGVGIRHDTPYTVAPVGVTMTVTPPPHWGKITGTVTGINCDGVGVAISGATVHIEGRTTVTLLTGSDGDYAWWMDARGRQYMIVGKDNYLPEDRHTSMNPNRETVENFTLTALC